MPYYSFILPSVLVNAAPRALIVKTKSNQSQGREATLLNVLHSCLMSRYQWEGRCLRLKTSTFKPCHILCQQGLGIDRADGVKAFLEWTFRLSQSYVGKGHYYAKSRSLQKIPVSNPPKIVSWTPPPTFFLSWDEQDVLGMWSDISIALVSHTLDTCLIVNALGPKVNSQSIGLLDFRGTDFKRKGQERIVAYELIPLIHPT